MKFEVEEESALFDSASSARTNKRDVGGFVKLQADAWSVERAMSVIGRGLGSSMLGGKAPEHLPTRSELAASVPTAQEIQEACAFLCMSCWERHPPQDTLSELPDATDMDAHMHMRKKKRLSDVSTLSTPQNPLMSSHTSRDYSSSSGPTPTPPGPTQPPSVATPVPVSFSAPSAQASNLLPTPRLQVEPVLEEEEEAVVEAAEALPTRLLICPVCTGPGRNPTDSHCQGCYTTLWKDARRVATNALDRATPDRWVVGDRVNDLERFLGEIQVVGKRCLTGSLNCDPSFYSHTRTNKCTRCRSKAAIQLLPALAHRQLCAAFKEIALELGLHEEPQPTAQHHQHRPAAQSHPAQQVRDPAHPIPTLPPAQGAAPPGRPSTGSAPPTRRASSGAPSPPSGAGRGPSPAVTAAAAALLAAAAAAPRRARAVASVTVTAADHASASVTAAAAAAAAAAAGLLPAAAAALVGASGQYSVPPSYYPLGYPSGYLSSVTAHAAMSHGPLLMHAGVGPAGQGMAPSPTNMASMHGGGSGGGFPSPFPWQHLPYGVPHYWVDAHGVAHMTPGVAPGVMAPSPSLGPSHPSPFGSSPAPAGLQVPQGFVYPAGTVAWPPTSFR